MIELRVDGFTYADIAKRAGVSRQRVQQLIAPPPGIRAIIIAKYNNRCFKCGVYVGASGHVHHEGSTNGDDYNDIENLLLLCPSCHRKAHGSSAVIDKCPDASKLLQGSQRYLHHCLRCDYEWLSKLQYPQQCACCSNRYWKTKKKESRLTTE